MAPFLIFALLSLLSVSIAEDRVHGLANESPASVPVSQEAYDFFHPNALQPSTSNPCDSSNCSTLPIAASVQSAPAHQSAAAGGHGIGAGGIAGISMSFVFVCLIGMGVYYVMIKNKANLQRAKHEETVEV